MSKGLTPYHTSTGKLNFVPTKITDKVWRAALSKWKYYIKVDAKFDDEAEEGLECSFCVLAANIGDDYVCKGCPLLKTICEHEYADFLISHDPAVVYDGLVKQYARWKARRNKKK